MVKKILKKVNNRYIYLSILLLTLFIGILSQNIYAAVAFQHPTLNSNKVYGGGSTYHPNSNDYPWDSRDVTSIGFDELYGTRKSFFVYYGEVPYKNKDSDFLKDESWYMYPGNKIDNNDRLWSDKELTEEDIDPNSTDPHIWAMTISHGFIGASAGKFALSIVTFLNYISSAIISILIWIKSFNLSSVVSLLDKNGDLVKQLSKIFLFDRENSIMSPILILALATFIISFISLSFKTIKGTGSANMRSVVQEILLFTLAAMVAAVFINSSNPTKVSNSGVDILNTLADNFVSSASQSSQIYTYNTGNATKDSQETQNALINKTYIDKLIEAQFGCSVGDLYITNGEGGEGDFGPIEDIQTAMTNVFGDGATVNEMAVITGSGDDFKINNLGYYLYAANSSVYINNGSMNNQTVFSNSGNGTNYLTASNDRVLFVIDFLSEIKEINKDKNPEMVKKVDDIMNNLTDPSYLDACVSTLLLTVLNVLLAYSLGMVTVFSILGQLIVILGSFCLVVMPLLILYRGTRRVAKQMIWTYIFAFLRYVIGTALFNTILVIVVLLCQLGTPGIIFSMVTCVVLGKFAPNLLSILNHYIMDAGRGKELNAMSKPYNSISRGFDKYNFSNTRAKQKTAGQIDKDGKSTTAQEGRDKNEKIRLRNLLTREGRENIRKDREKQFEKDAALFDEDGNPILNEDGEMILDEDGNIILPDDANIDIEVDNDDPMDIRSELDENDEESINSKLDGENTYYLNPNGERSKDESKDDISIDSGNADESDLTRESLDDELSYDENRSKDNHNEDNPKESNIYDTNSRDSFVESSNDDISYNGIGDVVLSKDDESELVENASEITGNSNVGDKKQLGDNDQIVNGRNMIGDFDTNKDHNSYDSDISVSSSNDNENKNSDDIISIKAKKENGDSSSEEITVENAKDDDKEPVKKNNFKFNQSKQKENSPNDVKSSADPEKEKTTSTSNTTSTSEQKPSIDDLAKEKQTSVEKQERSDKSSAKDKTRTVVEPTIDTKTSKPDEPVKDSSTLKDRLRNGHPQSKKDQKDPITSATTSTTEQKPSIDYLAKEKQTSAEEQKRSDKSNARDKTRTVVGPVVNNKEIKSDEPVKDSSTLRDRLRNSQPQKERTENSKKTVVDSTRTSQKQIKPEVREVNKPKEEIKQSQSNNSYKPNNRKEEKIIRNVEKVSDDGRLQDKVIGSIPVVGKPIAEKHKQKYIEKAIQKGTSSSNKNTEKLVDEIVKIANDGEKEPLKNVSDVEAFKKENVSKGKVQGQKKKERDRKLKNLGLRTVNRVPVVGEKINKSIVKKSNAKVEKKKEIMDNMIEYLSDISITSPNINKAKEEAKRQLMKGVREQDKSSYSKYLDGILDSMTQNDYLTVYNKMNSNRKQSVEGYNRNEASKKFNAMQSLSDDLNKKIENLQKQNEQMRNDINK